MSYADAITRETAWFTADPPPTFPTAPPLNITNGGKFSVIQAWIPNYSPRERSLYIVRGHGQRIMHEERIAFGGLKSFIHYFQALVLWPYAGGTGGTGKIEDELSALEGAVDDVLTRIRGPFGDKSHNGQFWTVAETEGDIEVEYEDVYSAVVDRRPFVVRINYVAEESFTA